MKCSLLFVFLIAAACQYPRDPEGTLDRVTGGVMKVGLIEHPPWVEKKNEFQAVGIECELLRRLAEELQSEMRVFWGSEEELFTALEHFELDVVAGGLTDATPWLKQVGVTAPYAETRVVVVTPPGTEIDGIEGMEVMVPLDEPAIAALVRKEGGKPVPRSTANLGELAAMPDWKARALDLQSSGIVLQTRRHVMAVPPGENAWIGTVERFLRGQRRSVEERLLQRAEETVRTTHESS